MYLKSANLGKGMKDSLASRDLLFEFLLRLLSKPVNRKAVGVLDEERNPPVTTFCELFMDYPVNHG